MSDTVAARPPRVLTPLRDSTQKHGEKAPETADLYFAYGKALLENAISQSGVLGKQDTDDSYEDDKGMLHLLCTRCPPSCLTRGGLEDANASGAFLSFSGDADDEPVDLFAEAQKAVDEANAAQAEEEEDEDEDAEPEDDFNAAWEVLDLARAIFEKQQDESDEVKLKLADVFIALGDVSLETGTIVLPICA